jgi:hypothetical protein
MDDSFWSRFGLELILLTFIVLLAFAMCHAHVTYQRRNKKHIDKEFRKAMAQHGIENVEILQDRRSGRGMRPAAIGEPVFEAEPNVTACA